MKRALAIICGIIAAIVLILVFQAVKIIHVPLAE